MAGSVTASVMAVIVISYFSRPKFRLVARSSVTWRWDSSALCGLYLRLESGPFRLVTRCDAGHELRKAGSDSWETMTPDLCWIVWTHDIASYASPDTTCVVRRFVVPKIAQNFLL